MVELPSVDCKVDWVSLTKRGFWTGLRNGSRVNDQYEAQLVAWSVFRSMGMGRATMEKCQHGKGYHYAFQEYQTGVRVNVAADLEQQGVMVVCSGDTLRKFDSVPGRITPLFESGFRCSRLDVAFDIYDSGVSVDRLASDYFDLHPQPSIRKASYIASGGGSTIYIGSRYSSKMLRIYDKGKQQQSPRDWIRAEIEYKREFIHEAAPSLVTAPWSAMHDVIDLLDMHRHLLTGVLLQFGEDVGQTSVVVGRPKTDTELWFETIVTSAFYNLAEVDQGAARRVLDGLMSVLDNGIDSKLIVADGDEVDEVQNI